MKGLKPFFLVTDIGFLLYWLITALHIIPVSLLFKDYDNPILVAWNWSFLPLDMLVSTTGLLSLYLYGRGDTRWSGLALVSLVLTCCAGLQALAFWSIRSDFDLVWWLPNTYLLLYPLFFLPSMLSLRQRHVVASPTQELT